MSQLTFKFPFKTSYDRQDFYVSSNNFEAYKLIESWPHWTNRFLNIYGPKGCGKTHLSIVLKNKINFFYIEALKFESKILVNLDKYEGLIIDNYNENINENLLYTALNQIFQTNKYIMINTLNPIIKITTKLEDLNSRFKTFIPLPIDLPTDDLLRVMITKSFSDKQIKINIKTLEYIIKNIDRSYENVSKFIKEIDNESLSSGKSININLIKKVLNK